MLRAEAVRLAHTSPKEVAENRGGTHEQHVKAGEQSHKNKRDDDMKKSGGMSRSDDDMHDDMHKGTSAHRGGSGNFAEDPARAPEAGRKGGKS